MNIERIAAAGAVSSLVDDARRAGICAIDTEFVWERTYAPVLCLVQLATPDRLAVVDPVDGAPLEPIAELLGDGAVEKVMHAPGADLTGFALHFGIPARGVFDTQLAAGFAGYGGSLSLERMLDASVKVSLRHSEGFTDWSKRPLTSTQVEYAADDVRYLLDAASALQRRLQSQGRERWAAEEMDRRFGPAAALVQDPDTAWRRVAGRGKLRSAQLGALVAAAAWREREARRRDIPVSWLVRDATLVELARRRPRTADDALAVRGLQLKRGRQLDELLAVLAGAGEGPQREAELSADLRNRVRAVLPLASAVLQAACSEAGIASELVATRDDLESLAVSVARGSADEHPLLQGWRRELAGERLLRLLNGEVALRVVPSAPHVVAQGV